MKSEWIKQGLDESAIHAIQEMSELTKDLTKCLLYGWGSHWDGVKNYEKVMTEMNDVRRACGRLLGEMQQSLTMTTDLRPMP